MVSRRVVLISGAVAVLVAAGVVAFVLTRGPSAPNSPLPQRTVHELALPGDNSRVAYASLDAQRGLLFVAHLGASEVIEIDVHANKVVRTIPNVSQVRTAVTYPVPAGSDGRPALLERESRQERGTAVRGRLTLVASTATRHPGVIDGHKWEQNSLGCSVKLWLWSSTMSMSWVTAR